MSYKYTDIRDQIEYNVSMKSTAMCGYDSAEFKFGYLLSYVASILEQNQHLVEPTLAQMARRYERNN